MAVQVSYAVTVRLPNGQYATLTVAGDQRHRRRHAGLRDDGRRSHASAGSTDRQPS